MLDDFSFCRPPDDPLSLRDSFNVADKIGRLYIQIDVNAKMILSQEHNLEFAIRSSRHASYSIVSHKNKLHKFE